MLTLALDTSAVTASVALVRDSRTVASFSVTNKLTHSQTLLPMIDAAFRISGLEISDLSLIAVSHGPGSFTGLRIGISTVKGLCFAHNLPCVGISTLEALAYNLIDCEGALICPCMDARRNEFYNALFEVKQRSLIRLTPDRAISGEALASELGGRDFIVCGDGAVKFVEGFAPDLRLAGEGARLQNAVSTALLAEKKYACGEFVAGERLTPVYLRQSGAERKKNDK